MFEKIGRKLIKGAKAEILESPQGIDWDKVLRVAVKVAEAGLFAAVIFWSGRPGKTPTIIVNQYIHIHK